MLFYMYLLISVIAVDCTLSINLFLEKKKKLHLLVYGSQFITSKIIPLSLVLLNLEIMERKIEIYKKLNISITKRAF